MSQEHPVLTRACLAAALDGGPPPARLYRRWWLEALAFAPWWSPYAVWAPVAAALVALGGGPLGVRALAGAAGALGWSLVEYGLHRWAFHLAPTTPARRVAAYLLHGHHHHAPDRLDRLVASPAQAAGALLPIAGLGGLAGLPGGDVLAGAIVAYLAYERRHLTWHHGRPRTRRGRRLRARHLRHHHGGEGATFGIGTDLWDRVLGTEGGPPTAGPGDAARRGRTPP